MKSSEEFEQRLSEFGKALRENDSMAHVVQGRIESETNLVTTNYAYSRRGFSKLGEISMRQRMTLGGMAAAALIAIVFFATSHTPSSNLFAEIAESIQRATSYSTEVKVEATDSGDKRPRMIERVYWQAPGSYRHERNVSSSLPHSQQTDAFKATDLAQWEPVEVRLVFPDKLGIQIDHSQKTYRAVSAQRGYRSPLMMLQSLANYKGHAEVELGEKTIEGIATNGFRLDVAKIDPSAGAGTMEVWIGTVDLLPRLLSIRMKDVPMLMTMHNFKWNEPLPAKLFDVTPPAGYTKQSPPMPERGSDVAKITAALKMYSNLSGGHYPKVKMVYGDVMRNKMLEMAGFKGRPRREWLDDKQYRRVNSKTDGMTTINVILRNNADAEYRGLHVGPNDKHQVLMKWRLPDGQYQLIFGDLSAEVVAADSSKLK